MKTKHLLNGVAVITALALSAPVWAQPANPSGGNAVGLPGPNPGGPGLTPYSTGSQQRPQSIVMRTPTMWQALTGFSTPMAPSRGRIPPHS